MAKGSKHGGRKSSLVDASNMDPGRLDAFSKFTEEESSRLEGLYCGAKVEGFPEFLSTPSETVTAGQNNTRIVLGRDRPASKFTGYGGRGDSHCGSIDIVAGSHGYLAKKKNEKGENIVGDPDFKTDAARIYLSQKTDIDVNFDLKDGMVGNHKAKSGIGLKADHVRIVAREGIKLVTKTDNKNSQGAPLTSIAGIDLIAGNDDSDMQPLVKGNELVIYLDHICSSIQELSGIVNLLSTLFMTLESAVAAHTHPVSVGWTGMNAYPSVELAAVAVANASQEMATLLPSQITNKVNTAMQQMNHRIKPLSSGDTSKLLSKHNHTN